MKTVKITLKCESGKKMGSLAHKDYSSLAEAIKAITNEDGSRTTSITQKNCSSIIEAMSILEEMGFDLQDITQIETETETTPQIAYTGCVKVPLSVVDNLITTAFEGGSNYWYMVSKSSVKKPKGFVRNENIHYEFLDKVYQGSSCKVYDVENDEYLGEINNRAISRGIRLMFEKYPQLMADAIAEEYDADSADLFLQMVVMGEVVYG